jgi:hypothetical protein
MHDNSPAAGPQGPHAIPCPPSPWQQPYPDDAIAWIVESGFSGSVDEAESLRRAILDDGPREDENPQGTWLPTKGITPPAVEDREIIQAVRDWRIVALGDRPEDHLVRDVLHASLLRDRRTRLFHRMTTEPAPWIKARVEGLPHRFHRQAVQHTVLDFMHRQLIGRLWRGLEGLQGPLEPDSRMLFNGYDYGLLLSLAACRPVGARLEWQGKQGRTHDYACGYARVCPWCHGRAVAALYRRLVDGPCRPGRLQGRHLVRVRLRVGNGELANHQPYLAYAKRNGLDLGAIYAAVLGRTGILVKDEVRLVRKFWLERLVVHLIAACGVEGGIWTFQVEPFLNRRDDEDGEPQYRFELNVIGETARDGNYRRRPIVGLDHIFAVAVEIDEAPADDPQALRRLLAGTPYKPGPNRPVGQSNKLHHSSEQGLSGALRLVPWFLVDESKWDFGGQWWSHYEATRGSRLFSAFGSWREGSSARGKEAAEARRREPLKAHNQWNQRRAWRRREELLAEARDNYGDLVERSVRKPGHNALRKAMTRNNFIVSERDARWLVKALSKE